MNMPSRKMRKICKIVANNRIVFLSTLEELESMKIVIDDVPIPSMSSIRDLNRAKEVYRHPPVNVVSNVLEDDEKESALEATSVGAG